MLSWPSKDPNEVLDYSINWADAVNPVLEAGETLLTSDYVVESGDVVIDSESFTPEGMTLVWLSSGSAGTANVVRNRVTTSAGRTYDKSARLRIRSH